MPSAHVFTAILYESDVSNADAYNSNNFNFNSVIMITSLEITIMATTERSALAIVVTNTNIYNK